MVHKLVLVITVAVLVVCAGCSNQPTDQSPTVTTELTESETRTFAPDTTRMPATETDTATPSAPSEEVATLRDELTDRGISVRSLEQSGDDIELTYGTIETRLAEHDSERAAVVRAYYQLYRDGGTTDRLAVRVVDQNGQFIGSYHIERGWLAAYNNGGMTDAELLDAVSDTLETSKPSYFQNTSESIGHPAIAPQQHPVIE